VWKESNIETKFIIEYSNLRVVWKESNIETKFIIEYSKSRVVWGIIASDNL